MRCCSHYYCILVLCCDVVNTQLRIPFHSISHYIILVIASNTAVRYIYFPSTPPLLPLYFPSTPPSYNTTTKHTHIAFHVPVPILVPLTTSHHTTYTHSRLHITHYTYSRVSEDNCDIDAGMVPSRWLLLRSLHRPDGEREVGSKR